MTGAFRAIVRRPFGQHGPMSSPARLLFLLLLTALAVALPAASAPWYQWRSQLNGELYCAQIEPGPGWTRIEGPFRDAGCQRKGRPGER